MGIATCSMQGDIMFIIVCASTPRSSLRVGCASPQEAQAKMAELEAAAIGKVRAFDDSGKRITPGELAAMLKPDADDDAAARPQSS